MLIRLQTRMCKERCGNIFTCGPKKSSRKEKEESEVGKIEREYFL